MLGARASEALVASGWRGGRANGEWPTHLHGARRRLAQSLGVRRAEAFLARNAPRALLARARCRWNRQSEQAERVGARVQGTCASAGVFARVSKRTAHSAQSVRELQ